MPSASTPEAAVRAMQDRGVLTLQKIKDGKIGLPTGKAEAWRHSNLRTMFPSKKYSASKNGEVDRKIIVERVNEYVDERCGGSYLVYVDGRFDRDLSRMDRLSDKVSIDTIKAGSVSGAGNLINLQSMSECMTAIPDTTELGRDSFSSDSLSAVNMANCDDACLILVKEGTIVGQPLQIINYCTDGMVGHDDSVGNNDDNDKIMPASFPKLALVLEADSHLTLKQTFIGRDAMVHTGAKARDLDNAALVVSNTKIYVSKGASLEHSYEQDLPAEHRHFEVVSAELSSGSSYDLSILQSGGKTGRVNAHVNLNEVNSNCSLNSVSLSHQRQSHDLHSSIMHNAPECESRQQHRNVLGCRGETIFKGRIRVPHIAQKTSSEQMCRTLIRLERRPALWQCPR